MWYVFTFQSDSMKKFLWFLVVLFFYSTAAAQPRTISSLTGTWVAVDADNASGGIQVIDSTKLFLIYGDQKKPITSYKLDFFQVARLV